MKNEKRNEYTIEVDRLEANYEYDQKRISTSALTIFAKFADPTLFTKILLLQATLYNISGAEFGNYSQENIKKHIANIKKEMYSFDKEGFISLSNLGTNKVLNAFRTIFPELEKTF